MSGDSKKGKLAGSSDTLGRLVSYPMKSHAGSDQAAGFVTGNTLVGLNRTLGVHQLCRRANPENGHSMIESQALISIVAQDPRQLIPERSGPRQRIQSIGEVVDPDADLLHLPIPASIAEVPSCEHWDG